ncbi:MAG: NAD(P)/FAD-dependent oxidoreductase [Methanobacterium sp.]|uniref:NAD(P)/FAD-dependent oxidoreductase n=1 Tax=Methanobacterium sp. TaxID=2164 RepID=UPI003D64AA1C|nr:NAD(P)/FAD-dependent oxidoreductase [Methanobacterium sp.]
MKLYDITVVGAGPAGMMAAIRAGQLGKNVILIERNDTLGKKLKITGSSRCNITNTASLDEFMEKFGKNGAFFRSAFATFSNRRLMSFFKDRGLKLKVEENGRVFPVTDKSRSVIMVLKDYLSENKVKRDYNTRLIKIKKKKDYFSLDLGNDNHIATKKVILATGGVSYPSTGSTGDGFEIAKKLGHKITPLKPGLVPLKASETWIKELQGITLQNVRLTFKYGKKKIISDKGNLIFTHYGISGPLVLDISNEIVSILKNETVSLFIDLKPEMTFPEIEEKLLSEFENRSKTEFKNLMKLFIPNRMIPIFTELLGIDPKKKANQVTKGERNSILNLLKAFPLTITDSLSIDKAMVTCGGVLKKEINPQTMESKIVSGIYFAGEIIDFCAPSGGYNLQEAFSTGYLAGESAAENLD